MTLSISCIYNGHEGWEKAMKCRLRSIPLLRSVARGRGYVAAARSASRISVSLPLGDGNRRTLCLICHDIRREKARACEKLGDCENASDCCHHVSSCFHNDHKESRFAGLLNRKKLRAAIGETAIGTERGLLECTLIEPERRRFRAHLFSSGVSSKPGTFVVIFRMRVNRSFVARTSLVARSL